jgi:hypothetical protein
VLATGENREEERGIPRATPGTTRPIALDDPESAWTALLDDLNGSAGDGLPDVEVTPATGPQSLFVDRVGRLVAAGYSVREDSWPRLVMAPRPAGLLCLVAGEQGVPGESGWAGLGAGRFRRYVLVLDAGTVGEGVPDALADESWFLADFCGRGAMPQFILEFIASRAIDVVQVVGSRLGVDLLPTIRFSFPKVRVAVDLGTGDTAQHSYLTYVTSRYGNLVDAYFVADALVGEELRALYIPDSRTYVVAPGENEGGLTVADLRSRLYGRLVAGAIDRAP